LFYFPFLGWSFSFSFRFPPKKAIDFSVTYFSAKTEGAFSVGLCFVFFAAYDDVQKVYQ